MVPLVVPEEEWGPDSWAVTHPLYVESQIEYGLDEASYGYWGFSPSSNPAGGYREYGVDAIGMEPERLHRRRRSPDAHRPRLGRSGRAPCRTDHRRLRRGRRHAARRLPRARLRPRRGARQPRPTWRDDFPGLYGTAASRTRSTSATGQVANRYLALDQGMVIAAIANELTDDQLQGYLAMTLQPSLQPLMEIEQFGAGRVTP